MSEKSDRIFELCMATIQVVTENKNAERLATAFKRCSANERKECRDAVIYHLISKKWPELLRPLQIVAEARSKH